VESQGAFFHYGGGFELVVVRFTERLLSWTVIYRFVMELRDGYRPAESGKVIFASGMGGKSIRAT